VPLLARTPFQNQQAVEASGSPRRRPSGLGQAEPLRRGRRGRCEPGLPPLAPRSIWRVGRQPSTVLLIVLSVISGLQDQSCPP